ncbi:MAG: hypothetical protein JKY61_04895 [Planctomycetes bacterium]|nr:hypothetical protein [Planctomycetota bacterium]
MCNVNRAEALKGKLHEDAENRKQGANEPARIIHQATDLGSEAPSDLPIDPTTEHHTQRGLNQTLKDRTCFVIAHRLSTIENADRILVVHEGHIVQEDTHATLMAQAGRYSTLHAHQPPKKAGNTTNRTRSRDNFTLLSGPKPLHPATPALPDNRLKLSRLRI